MADLWQCCGLPATKSVPDIFTPNNRKTFVFYIFSRHFHGDRSDRTRCFQNHYLLYNIRSSTKVAMNQHSLKFFVSGSLQEIFFWPHAMNHSFYVKFACVSEFRVHTRALLLTCELWDRNTIQHGTYYIKDPHPNYYRLRASFTTTF